MPKFAVRYFLFVLVCLLGCALSLGAQTSPKPLRASELIALEAGGALQENVVHHVTARGINFHPDDEFLALLKKTGADTTVLAALKTAKVSADDAKPDRELLQQLSNAGILLKDKHYYEAATELSKALKASFAGPETGFVMGELLRQQREFPQAASVYAEVLRQDPNFPEAHTKASYILCKLADPEDALSEAKAAIAENPDNAEAHRNAGLALDSEQKFDAGIAEYKQALRIKPNYPVAHYDLGLLLQNMRAYDDAIVEYKKAVALDPTQANAHTNLGFIYKEVQGRNSDAVIEFREAKRLDPNNPMARQNLGAALMSVLPEEAVRELREMEKMFPDFEMCHLCLAHGLESMGDKAGAEAEYVKASALEPSDPQTHIGLGNIREKEKNYDVALEEFRMAEKLGPEVGQTHADIGRVLLAKKDVAGALAELKQAEVLSPSSWNIHESYGQALRANGQTDLAISEFKEAIALDPTLAQVMDELAAALEKKGDWVGALEQYRKAALSDADRLSKAQVGQAVWVYDPDPQKAYTEAKARFADHEVELKAAGKMAEAADLEKRVRMLDTADGTLEKVQAAMQSGKQAMHEGHIDDAEKSFKEAVELAEHLPPGNENLIVALGMLGNAYAMRQDYSDADAAFHRELAVIEKTFGAASPRTTDPLRFLGEMALGTGNFTAGEGYFQRALDVNLKAYGENSGPTLESLRMMALVYRVQKKWDKAEPYLLRAVKSGEIAAGPETNDVLVPLYGLCDLYDRWGKPEKSHPCWHRVTGIVEKVEGESSPGMSASLTNEANALRKLGRKDEAEQIEERLRKIHRAAQTN